jgi:hypothetical protein
MPKKKHTKGMLWMRPSPQVREEIDKIKRETGVSYSGIMRAGVLALAELHKNDKDIVKRLNKETMKGVWKDE